MGWKNYAKPKLNASNNVPAPSANKTPGTKKHGSKPQSTEDKRVEAEMFADLVDNLYQPPLAHDTPLKTPAPQRQVLAVRPPATQDRASCEVKSEDAERQGETSKANGRGSVL